MTSPVVERIADGARFARVTHAWEGETVAILGGGPSLTPDQVEQCRGLKVISVNDAYLLAPWADVLYFADSRWWGWQQDGRERKGFPALGLSPEELKARYRAFAGLKVSISNAEPMVKEAGVLFLKNHGDNGAAHGSIFSDDPTMIATGSNSCYQALNIAILAGAKTILFLGLDGANKAGKQHWFGAHPNGLDPAFEGIRQHFRSAAPWCAARGITVLNCSPGTSVSAFHRAELADAIAGRFVPAVTDAQPEAVASVYVRVSDWLKQHPNGLHWEALTARFSSERIELQHALRKGLKKGTILESEGVYRRAESLVHDQAAAVVSG